MGAVAPPSAPLEHTAMAEEQEWGLGLKRPPWSRESHGRQIGRFAVIHDGILTAIETDGPPESGHAACVRHLLKRGADPNARDRYGRTAYMDVKRNDTACKAALVAHGARVDLVDFGNAQASVERWAGTSSSRRRGLPPCPMRNCAIIWRSLSLQRISFGGGSVTREDDGLTGRPAVQAGGRVRVLGTDGDWEVASVLGDAVELRGREGTVPVDQLVFAGPGFLAWQEANAAEARGQSNVITRVLSRRGYISTRVRSVVTDFQSTLPSPT